MYNPIKVPEVIDAATKLAEFQSAFDAPPPWLVKTLGISAEQRTRFIYQTEESPAN